MKESRGTSWGRKKGRRWKAGVGEKSHDFWQTPDWDAQKSRARTSLRIRGGPVSTNNGKIGAPRGGVNLRGGVDSQKGIQKKGCSAKEVHVKQQF